jgi:hypothetical protein
MASPSGLLCSPLCRNPLPRRGIAPTRAVASSADLLRLRPRPPPSDDDLGDAAILEEQAVGVPAPRPCRRAGPVGDALQRSLELHPDDTSAHRAGDSLASEPVGTGLRRSLPVRIGRMKCPEFLALPSAPRVIRTPDLLVRRQKIFRALRSQLARVFSSGPASQTPLFASRVATQEPGSCILGPLVILQVEPTPVHSRPARQRVFPRRAGRGLPGVLREGARPAA